MFHLMQSWSCILFKHKTWILLLAFAYLHAAKVGLCIVATGRYNFFANQLIQSARQYFCVGHEVHYFVFADHHIDPAPDVTVVFQKRLGWPYDTLLRCKIYDEHRELYADCDYVYATDADMRFVAPVGEEILSERVGTQHPGFVGRRGTYDTNPQSRACMQPHEGKVYFAGGFYGGTAVEFIKLNAQLVQHILHDISDNVMAIWHDESHLNRYFWDNCPTLILSPSYCYPESWDLPYIKRLLALDKNHKEYRK